MFNVILLGGLCTAMGIGAGYLILNAFFAGVQYIAKPRVVDVEDTSQKILDN